MPFVTKPDFSNNRQAKQFQFTSTQLSGTTVFGVDDVYIPATTADTINIDALQYIRTRGLIFANSIPEFTGSTYQVLGRDNDTGKIVEITSLSGLTGGTTIISGDTGNDYTTGATFNKVTGIAEFTRQSGDTYTLDLETNAQVEHTVGFTILDSHNNKTMVLNSSADRIITVNSGLTEAFGTEFININSGKFTFQAGTANLNTPDGTQLLSNKVAFLIKIGTGNTYFLKGELE